jgi:heptosyltransferase III
LRHALEQGRRILLVRIRSLGDSILSLPLVDALHSNFPSAQIDVVAEGPFAPVFQHHPAIAGTLVLRHKSGRGAGSARHSLLFEIRRRGYDAVFNLHGGTTSFLITLASGSPLRVGQESFRRRWAYNVRIPSSAAVWGRSGVHTVEHQLSALKWMGLPVPAEIPLKLWPDPRAVDRIRERLRAESIGDEAFVQVHPTATLATKAWPPARFAEIADRISGETGMPVVFTSAETERPVLDQVSASARRQHRYWSDLELPELFALIGASRLFVGNDSGPAHAASALGRPVCVVWGSSNFVAWRPWNTRFEALKSSLPCMPCPGYTCREFGEPRCILDIPAEPVIEACRRLLRTSG